jgi:hypothetical protein
MRRKSIDEQLLDMERKDRSRRDRNEIRLTLTAVLSQAIKIYGTEDKLTLAIRDAWRISAMEQIASIESGD